MNLHNDNIIKISSILKKYDSLHCFFKKIYFKLNYFLFANKNFKYEIINGFEHKFLLDQNKEFFFGYYHNTPWSYDDKFLAINSIADNRTVCVNIVNLSTSEIIFTDKTTLWNFQQGPMLGWFPLKHVIYYNKLIDGIHKTVLYNMLDEKISYFNFPIQAIHPGEESYLSINYSNLHMINKDYGYKNKCKEMSKYDNGIWKCYFDNVDSELLISIEDIKKINSNLLSDNDELNHCLFSNNGKYFLFIYRYKNDGKKYSKLILVDYDSSNYDMVVINNLFVSHMCWIDNENILYFGDSSDESRGYFIYNLISNKSKRIMLENLNDGHPSVNKDKKWVIIDTYPDKKYNCHLYLYNMQTMETINVGKFRSDIRLHGYDRCDLHPRWNNKGTQVMIDSSHENKRYPIIIDLEKSIHEKK